MPTTPSSAFGLGAEARAGFEEIRVTAMISGPEPPQRKAESYKIVEEHCPVQDLLANPVSMRATLRFGPEPDRRDTRPRWRLLRCRGGRVRARCARRSHGADPVRAGFGASGQAECA